MGRKQIIRSVYVPRSAGLAATLAEEGRGCDCCGVCRICTCLRWTVLTTPTGIVKSCQMALSLISQLLIMAYGVKYAGDLGISFLFHLTTCSASLFVSLVLLATYTMSQRSLLTVRPSVFEILFNVLCSVLFLTTSGTLTFQVHKSLFYFYSTIPGFNAYPALTVVYVFGYMLGVLHAIDAILAFKDMKTL